jgi:hypothetical protein
MATRPGAEPKEKGPSKNWEHYALYSAVKNALYSLPSRFESSLRISNMLATDLFAFNSALSATIEEQVVTSLNKLRTVWDSDQKYALYDFERRPQTFPDVVLKASSKNLPDQIVLGIELKGWYVLAKEREPSFRYKVTPAVCADADLLVVVPWALSEVVSGTPKIFAPFITSAKYAAEYKNWYWQHKKTGASDKNIILSKATQQYPIKSDMISDSPRSDGGSNFGRLARTGLLNEYIGELFNERLVGIALSYWQKFLAIFTEGSFAEDMNQELDALIAGIREQTKTSTHNRAALIEKIQEIINLTDKTGAP